MHFHLFQRQFDYPNDIKTFLNTTTCLCGFFNIALNVLIIVIIERLVGFAQVKYIIITWVRSITLWLIKIVMFQVYINIPELLRNGMKEILQHFCLYIRTKNPLLRREKRLVDIINAIFLFPCYRHDSLIVVKYQPIPIVSHCIKIKGITIDEAINSLVYACIPFGFINLVIAEILYVAGGIHQKERLRSIFRRLKPDMLMEKEIFFHNRPF